MRIFQGIIDLMTIIILEFFIVLVAMAWDFASGYYKARLRGEQRTSYGLRRSISKFILYAGSVCIACGIDSICYVCRFWEFVRLSPLMHVPVVTSILAIFILITEVLSIWEKADAKQHKQMDKTTKMISKILNRGILTDVLVEAIKKAKEEGKK